MERERADWEYSSNEAGQSPEKPNDLVVGKQNTISQSMSGVVLVENVDREFLVPPLNWLGIIENFQTTVAAIEDRLDIKLPLKKRWVKFVNTQELKPKTKDEEEELTERYGEYVLTSKIGDFKKLKDGTFRLRVGCTNGESEDEVLWVLAHEYGHTLGKQIKDSTLEELKAYAFQALFMKIYDDSEWNIHDLDEDQINHPHDIAKNWLGLMLIRKITLKEALRNLVGEPFKEDSRDQIVSDCLTSLQSQHSHRLKDSSSPTQ